jgi:hypothetical protein
MAAERHLRLHGAIGAVAVMVAILFLVQGDFELFSTQTNVLLLHFMELRRILMRRRNFFQLIAFSAFIFCIPKAHADTGCADSTPFYLNLSVCSTSSQNSSSFSLNLSNVSRSWADSNVFPYMWTNATSPPNPDVLLLRPAGQLKLVDPSITYIYPNKPTIILTHGWNPNYPGIKIEPGSIPEWISQMGNHMLNKPWGANYNILWWD